MNNKPHTKKQWQAPEIIDLDVKNTKGGSIGFTYEGTTPFGQMVYTSS